MERDLSRRRERAAPRNAREVLGYFVRNPQTADTLEGVARWRLMEERVDRSVEEVDEALRWLVAHGYLVEELLTGVAPIFRLGPTRTAEIERFLNQSEDTTDRG